jgi:hypothetical protein
MVCKIVRLLRVKRVGAILRIRIEVTLMREKQGRGYTDGTQRSHVTE